MPRRRTIALVGAALVLVGGGTGLGIAHAVGDDGPTPSRAAADRPCGRQYVELLTTELPEKEDLHAVVVGRVDEPTAIAFAPDGSGDGLIGSRTGQVRAVHDDEIEPEVVLDLSDDTLDHGDGGLLGLAYDPVEPWLYVYRSTQDEDEELLAYPLDADGRPEEGGERLILPIDHPPSEQHHGGGFGFGPDGHLYLGLGDGGGLGDPNENAQDPSELLGKILRIDPTPEAEEPYAVPADNPFVGRAGYRPEIWAMGLRNPFRLGFDDATGDVWVGDVGQSCWEELNRLPAGEGGQNFGWDVREGNTEFEGGSLTDGVSVEPEQVYAHRRGWCAIVAGFVGPDGGFLHTDYCKGRIMEFWPADDTHPPRLIYTGVDLQNPVALVEGPGGVPWVLTLGGGVYQLRD